MAISLAASSRRGMMASVLLSTVGQAVGGPFGAGIGAAVGASLDTARARRAGQASDLYLQQSAYGETVPRLFGTMRTAGHLIWALRPEPGGGRKGDGRREAEASFAIALSRGPVREVRRIWADGREIRSGDGVSAFGFEMRVHSMPVRVADPLIAAAEGTDGAPALRGLSHVVFEGFPLGPFGNRIPSLSFELVADDGGADLWAAEVASEAGLRAEALTAPPGITGFVQTGSPLPDDIERISRICGAEIRHSDGDYILGGSGTTHAIRPVDALSDPGTEMSTARFLRDRRPAGLSLTYIDPDRDYQLGLQRRQTGRSGQLIELSWAIGASAGAAKALCRQALRREEARRERLNLSLPHRWMHVSIGDRVEFGDSGGWRVVRRDIRGLNIHIEAERIEEVGGDGGEASDPGRSLSDAVVPAGLTRALVFESPVPAGLSGPSVTVVGGGGPGWRGAAVSVLDAGMSVPIGRLPTGRGVGELAAHLPAGPETIWDEHSFVLVRLDGQDGLVSRDHAGVLGGGGLILVGRELIQARQVDRLGEGIVRLSGLLRQRYATPCESQGWPAGTGVAEVILSECPEFAVTGDAPGREIVLLAEGRGDPAGGTEMLHRIEGAGLAPLAPVHLQAEQDAAGRLMFRWVGRRRGSWTWAEENMVSGQGYVWRCRLDGGHMHELWVDATELTLSLADQLSILGEELSGGEFQVEAVGDGPKWVRCSAWTRI
jgi:hypothetical protein